MEADVKRREKRPARGSSLIEVLIAMAILALMMVGVLQMFSVALLTNYGSAARTEMTYKSQQVIENLRMIYFFASGGTFGVADAAGVPRALGVTTGPILLPYPPGTDGPSQDGAATKYTFWGPAGVNCVAPEPDGSAPAYQLSYTVADGGANWLVTVTATPVESPLAVAGAPTPPAGARRFLGVASRLKRVDYVANIPKAI
jgi:prepilin-type N-terminal cleavage/methylation domain-containing protein